MLLVRVTGPLGIQLPTVPSSKTLLTIVWAQQDRPLTNKSAQKEKAASGGWWKAGFGWVEEQRE